MRRPPPRGFRCKKLGHYRRDCPKNAGGAKSSTKDGALLCALAVNVEDGWYIDSGATNHMCNNKKCFQDLNNDGESFEVNVANGDKLKTMGCGSLQLNLNNEVKTVSNVFYVPNLSCNLLSVSEMVRKG